ncbi:MAG TPA: DUF4148 domain-containing protein [Ramlibacter sp.]|uniref:DUF4148 domain-containing protein n=1 Tax=Ramlibacter sp. TaxID=1917967 RepID=UPI002D7F0EAA|nr:DUF4148 domain-containing protein [Ramlibacter sp.]HET8746742.1 DUF4148 domain-containing protein [Ramlibacter sp.]
MKTTLITFAFALAATGAFAETPNAAGEQALAGSSHVTRAEVRQQVIAARADGTLLRAGEQGQQPQAFVSSKTRAQVRAEVLQGPRHPYASGYQPA